MRRAWILFIFVFWMCFLPEQVFAHAVLTDASPAADSRLNKSPETVTLTFNEKIKDGLFDVEIINQEREKVQTKEVGLTAEGRQIHLSLPELSDGAYLLSYQVVSADGHPVKGSYVFLVGESSLATDFESKSDQFQWMDLFIYFIRALYYLALLWVIGWVFWGVFYSSVYRSEKMGKKFKFTSLILQQAHLLCLIILIVTQWLFQSTSTGIPVFTSFGFSWIVSLALSLIGFFVLARFKWIDVTWVILMLVAKSFNGHANSYDPLWGTISSNFVHLLAAAIWAGGLLFIVVFWRKFRLQVRDFIQVFSKVAFVCIVVLWITGIVTTLLFLSDITLLWITPWGRLLILKMVFVLCVILVAWKVRTILKDKPLTEAWKWIRTDLFFMLLIMILVGGLTYISPIPANSPLEWEEENEKVKMMVNISPKAPGENQFQVQFQSDEVQRVELWLYYEGKDEIPPILVPLKPSETKGSYSAEGYYLPFHGKWVAEVKVFHISGEEFVYKKVFQVFETVEQ
ncbi:copper resistance protein CopC/CopD [Mesobacillus maritimus]|uniref:copper resistance CopC/CopD family protein n=1 Tax=Mesobacillus maritimus TaxID=1643336 RepID=UPI002042348D|nr:copper resistance protein CopC/CopD [Mesobacillus maritimus]